MRNTAKPALGVWSYKHSRLQLCCLIFQVMGQGTLFGSTSCMWSMILRTLAMCSFCKSPRREGETFRLRDSNWWLGNICLHLPLNWSAVLHLISVLSYISLSLEISVWLGIVSRKHSFFSCHRQLKQAPTKHIKSEQPYLLLIEVLGSCYLVFWYLFFILYEWLISFMLSEVLTYLLTRLLTHGKWMIVVHESSTG